MQGNFQRRSRIADAHGEVPVTIPPSVQGNFQRSRPAGCSRPDQVRHNPTLSAGQFPTFIGLGVEHEIRFTGVTIPPSVQGNFQQWRNRKYPSARWRRSQSHPQCRAISNGVWVTATGEALTESQSHPQCRAISNQGRRTRMHRTAAGSQSHPQCRAISNPLHPDCYCALRIVVTIPPSVQGNFQPPMPVDSKHPLYESHNPTLSAGQFPTRTCMHRHPTVTARHNPTLSAGQFPTANLCCWAVGGGYESQSHPQCRAISNLQAVYNRLVDLEKSQSHPQCRAISNCSPRNPPRINTLEPPFP